MKRQLTSVLVSVAFGALLACGGSPAAPHTRQDLTGRWRGFAEIPTTGLATPLEITQIDDNGALTGNGGGVDCRYFATCGSFYSYVVTGSHEASRLTLNGRTPEGRTWTLSGSIDSSGLSMDGVVLSQDFPTSPWQMSKQQ